MDELSGQLIEVMTELKHVASAIHEIKDAQAEQNRLLQKALRTQEVHEHRIRAVEDKQSLLNGRLFYLSGVVVIGVLGLIVKAFVG